MEHKDNKHRSAQSSKPSDSIERAIHRAEEESLKLRNAAKESVQQAAHYAEEAALRAKNAAKVGTDKVAGNIEE